MKMNKSVLMAVIVAIVIAVWMASGMQKEAEPVVQAPSDQDKSLMKVKVEHSSASRVQQFVLVQGHVEANRTIELKVEVDGRVAALMVDEGQRVKAGDQLMQLSADYRTAQLAEAKAVLAQRKSDLAASRQLKTRGLQSESKLFADEAAVQAAEAQLAKARYESQGTRLEAPFAGVLNKRMVELGDYMKVGDVLGELVDDGTVKVTAQVPQHSVGRLVENQTVQIVLSNGQEMTGTLSFIAPVADAVTRSYRVEVQIPNPSHQRIIGLSASLQLPAGEALGHLLPGSVLGLDAAGNLQVKLVDDNNRVVIVPVEIIRTDTEGFWLSGLDNEVSIITIGQDFVAVGEEVEPVSDTELVPTSANTAPTQED